MKTVEAKRQEAKERQESSSYVAEVKPCCKCKSYRDKQCHAVKEMPVYTGRKQTCGTWRKA